MIVQIAVFTPLRKVFDYLVPQHTLYPLSIGMRVAVPFGRQKQVGIVIRLLKTSDIAINKLKPVDKVLDDRPVFDNTLLEVLLWASEYYHHPIGEVLQTALPASLRQPKGWKIASQKYWSLTALGQTIDPQKLTHAPRQKALLQLFQTEKQLLSDTQITALLGTNLRSVLHTLEKKQWLKSIEKTIHPESSTAISQAELTLNREQQQALQGIIENGQQFQVFLLEGITGSGKTEVYLQVIKKVLQQQRQVLVLVPEIGLTPQLLSRFQQRFTEYIVTLHSALTDRQRLQGWYFARENKAQIVIGTRSAVFTPMPQLGLIILDEEHDLSFKQQDNFRYSARDLAVIRASKANIPIILGSATPSFESIYNAETGRYQRLFLSQRAGNAKKPRIDILDIRSAKPKSGLSDPLLQLIAQHLEAKQQVLLFQNRRGYAPVLMCDKCTWMAHCQHCDARMTLHQKHHYLSCHHCGASISIPEQCPDCQSTGLLMLGVGTERLEESLQAHFPSTDIIRIDRDTTKARGELEQVLKQVEKGQQQILLGTQMLAKGHHFPNVTLVALIDIDQGFFSVDFRATERTAQLITQVAGRAGREDKAGQVVIQTAQPHHPLLETIVQKGYSVFVQQALEERRLLALPPYCYYALLRAEATQEGDALKFLQQQRNQAKKLLLQQTSVQLLGPVSAPMEKRANWYRAQLLVQASQRTPLHRFLAQWMVLLQQGYRSAKLRWSLDVDPMDML